MSNLKIIILNVYSQHVLKISTWMVFNITVAFEIAIKLSSCSILWCWFNNYRCYHPYLHFKEFVKHACPALTLFFPFIFVVIKSHVSYLFISPLNILFYLQYVFKFQVIFFVVNWDDNRITEKKLIYILILSFCLH